MTWYDYECKKCKHVQIKYHKMNEKNEESCVRCKAKPKDLQRCLSRPTHHGHSSWEVK